MNKVFQEGPWKIVATAVAADAQPGKWIARCSISKPGFEEALHDINARFYDTAEQAMEAAHICGQLAIAEKTLG